MEKKKKSAIKVPLNFKYKDLFVELNSSECLKEQLDTEAQKYYGLIKECVWPTGRSPHLIMDYFKYTLEDKIGSLYTLKWDRLSINRKKKALYDMLMITNEIKTLHHFGIAHRDLKPENIMINEKLTPILVDFGMTTTNGNRSKTSCGTPFYADYELYYKKHTGLTSDIYALGIIFANIYLGENSNDIINTMIENGKRGTTYEPRFKDLHAPIYFNWAINMFKPSKGKSKTDDRWTAEEVYAKLTILYHEFDSQLLI